MIYGLICDFLMCQSANHVLRLASPAQAPLRSKINFTLVLKKKKSRQKMGKNYCQKGITDSLTPSTRQQARSHVLPLSFPFPSLFHLHDVASGRSTNIFEKKMGAFQEKKKQRRVPSRAGRNAIVAFFHATTKFYDICGLSGGA